MSAAAISPPRISGDWSIAPIALTMPSTAATIPIAGSASAISEASASAGFILLLANRRDLLVHQRFDLEAAGVTDQDQAACSRRRTARAACPSGHVGNLLEQLGLFRLVDMLLHLIARLRLQIAHHARTEAPDSSRYWAALRSPCRSRRLDDRFAAPCSSASANGLATTKMPSSDAEDDDELERLPKHRGLAAHRHEAAEHRAEAEHDSN